MNLDKYIDKVKTICLCAAGVLALLSILSFAITSSDTENGTPLRIIQIVSVWALLMIGVIVYLILFLKRANAFKKTFEGKGYVRTLSEIQKKWGKLADTAILDDSVVSFKGFKRMYFTEIDCVVVEKRPIIRNQTGAITRMLMEDGSESSLHYFNATVYGKDRTCISVNLGMIQANAESVVKNLKENNINTEIRGF